MDGMGSKDHWSLLLLGRFSLDATHIQTHLNILATRYTVLVIQSALASTTGETNDIVIAELRKILLLQTLTSLKDWVTYHEG